MARSTTTTWPAPSGRCGSLPNPTLINGTLLCITARTTSAAGSPPRLCLDDYRSVRALRVLRSSRRARARPWALARGTDQAVHGRPRKPDRSNDRRGFGGRYGDSRPNHAPVQRQVLALPEGWRRTWAGDNLGHHLERRTVHVCPGFVRE